MASVMTTSSAFFWVLLTISDPQTYMGQAAYIADSPLLLGLRWLRMELSLSVAMIYDCTRRRLTGEEVDVEEKRKG